MVSQCKLASRSLWVGLHVARKLFPFCFFYKGEITSDLFFCRRPDEQCCSRKLMNPFSNHRTLLPHLIARFYGLRRTVTGAFLRWSVQIDSFDLSHCPRHRIFCSGWSGFPSRDHPCKLAETLGAPGHRIMVQPKGWFGGYLLTLRNFFVLYLLQGR